MKVWSLQTKLNWKGFQSGTISDFPNKDQKMAVKVTILTGILFNFTIDLFYEFAIIVLGGYVLMCM